MLWGSVEVPPVGTVFRNRLAQGGTAMKATDLKAFRTTLENLRSRLRGDVSTMADEALRKNRSEASGDLSTMPLHMADLGTDAYEQEFTLSLMASEEETLELIEQALERIRTKRFGSCLECGSVITKKRLTALPYAPHCIRCAEKMETGMGRPVQPR